MNGKAYLLLTLSAVTGCFLPPENSTRQNAVPEVEILALRHNDEGLRFIAGGRYVDARFRFLKSLYLVPQAPRVTFNLGVALYLQESYKDAQAIFADLFSDDPVLLPYRLWLAKTELELGNIEYAAGLLQDGLAEAELRPDLPAASAFARSLSNLYVRTGEVEKSLCSSVEAYSLAPSIDEGLKHVRLLLSYDQATAAENFFKTVLTSGGGGSLNYQLRRVETALLKKDLPTAKEHIQAAFHLNAIDPFQVYDRRLLSAVVGMLLQKKGEEVDLTVLNDEEAVEEIFQDPRAEQSPIYPVIQSLLEPVPAPQ